jgi:hypothetical protein
MTVSSFVVGYQSRLARLKSTALPPEIQGHLLLRQKGFDRHTQGLIVASASGSFKLHDVVNALKGLYGQAISMPTPITKLPNFGNSAASFTDSGSMYSKGFNASGGRRSLCSHCYKVGHSQDTCWAFIRSNGMSDKADEVEAATKRKKKKSSERNLVQKSKLLPLQKTLRHSTLPLLLLRQTPTSSTLFQVAFWIPELLEQLAVTVRTVEDSSHRVQKFGTNGEPLKRLFSCELPWNAVQTNGECFSFKCYALLWMRPLSISWAECSVVISCGKVDYDKSG